MSDAVLTLLALDQQGASYQCVALNALQHHVVNPGTAEPVPGATRNILEESSRCLSDVFAGIERCVAEVL